MLKLIMPNGLSRDYRTIRRFIKIMETMGAYGFRDLAENVYPNHRFSWMKRSPGGTEKHSRPQKLRLMFEELFCLNLGLTYLRTRRASESALPFPNQDLAALTGSLPFQLTQAQRRAIDEAAADQTLRSIIRFLNSRGVIRSETAPGHSSTIITNGDMTSVSATSAGLLRRVKFAGAHVRRGEQLAFVINPCDGSVREVLKTPVTGMLFFMQDGPFVTEHSPVFQVLAGA